MKVKKIIAIGMVFMLTASCMACGKSEEASKGGSTGGNLVANGGFENEELTDWTINNINNVTEEVGLYDRESDVSSGAQSFHFYSSGDVDFTLEQTISDVESGTYKLSCQIQGDGAVDSDIYLYAIVDGETYQAETSLDGYLVWNSPEITDINVENGTITVGMAVKNGPGGWGTIDDFVLEKQ